MGPAGPLAFQTLIPLSPLCAIQFQSEMEFYAQGWISMAEAVLIGLLVGIERESDREERHAGLRDFLTIGLAGGLCGLLAIPVLTVAALLAITALLVVFRLQTPGRTGITTEIAAVATFLLCVLTATHSIPWGSPLAIALTVVLALFLDARDSLRRFFIEVITEREFHDTLRFLAVIFVIYPVLPGGAYGPYGFLNPRAIWLFVILVCSISYLGYFLEKFFGERHGLALSAVLGGVASTTAATLAFARQAVDTPEKSHNFAQAAVLANAILGPRIFAILLFVSPVLAWRAAPALAALLVTGVAAAFLLGAARRQEHVRRTNALSIRNPFHLGPALQFGALFALVRLIARAGSAEFGQAGVMWAALIGGSIDVDAVAFSVSGLARDGSLDVTIGALAVLVALSANAVLKTALAFGVGGPVYGRSVLLGFVVMLGAAAGVMLIPN